MEQFIFRPENRVGSTDGDMITIEGEEHFHLSRVLRAKAGEKIFATDGNGTTCLCIVVSTGKDISTCKVVEEYYDKNVSRRKFCIGMAVLKPISKLEFAIEKCVELGAAGFLLFHCERSEKGNLRFDRIAGIMRSAVKQSLQSRIPELAIVKSLEEVISGSHEYAIRFVLHEKSDTMVENYLSGVEKDAPIVALIGPEGGFSDNEIEFLKKENFNSVSVGKPRLRSETAAIKIASLLATY